MAKRTRIQTASAVPPSQAAMEMAEAGMADSIAMMMQNATACQKAMQTMTNTAVANGCSMILTKGAMGATGLLGKLF